MCQWSLVVWADRKFHSTTPYNVRCVACTLEKNPVLLQHTGRIIGTHSVDLPHESNYRYPEAQRNEHNHPHHAGRTPPGRITAFISQFRALMYPPHRGSVQDTQKARIREDKIDQHSKAAPRDWGAVPPRARRRRDHGGVQILPRFSQRTPAERARCPG